MRGFKWFLIWFVVFLVRFWFEVQEKQKIAKFAGDEVRLTGRISSVPILQGTRQNFDLGRVKVVTERFPEYHYGDRLRLSGTLEEKVLTPGYSRFSLVYPSVSKIETYSTNSWVFRLRSKLEGIFRRNLPEPEASLLSGIVLGIKSSLPYDFWQALRKTSTLHIVVASGYNVTVVIGTVIKYLAGLIKRSWAVGLGVAAVVVYTLMAGGEPAIVRAAIMGSLAYLGQVLGRKSDGVRLLLAAAGVMLWVEPSLVYDVGFRLSVAATAGLLLIAPLLGKVFDRVALIGKDLSETTAAQIAVWPILLTTFGQVSAFSILINGLILWLVPMIMVLGAVLAGAGLVLGPWAAPIGWLAYGPLHLMVGVISWFGGLSFVSWTVDLKASVIGSFTWVFLYYLVLGVVIWRKR
ncbi:MAG: ComEC/Rec2-related protein [Candidatus Beckwithbacteria bacterium GW2011_GWB1_47_15]|uniref:ComEC/Rec2-related protein n=1 Tax=Candidatus Beckwithbacteria bacterium GW2011_GWB1_47_15 TaxID=1618371 RepID=A0A0G1U459_9BACT|nr:MAG: ComEC/Rec2-like protein, competence protein ComEC [Candidatus Beckwithbacteria bacterium GW2011_GWC1_49_16]KKU35413.1 MAG: ComEC/Rec2-related protein [Candidatus Beckwithbacteria bacterium GW2011_GWA1_46_30]KKU61088.1 MAG: ComEC/Rec2-related protein [Candidatus Beckwithbacteria bacterium GW2011_GWB1_47_15]KKU71927.1 MAG: ComEC/Rec2-related protein [Candidatus Beckwithbacteria bacterium GW2011_GWA2_47_25]KKW02942.1 MAG: ComEC/Rec2-related protein [Candidatus Beckwithbacteria bacterium GW